MGKKNKRNNEDDEFAGAEGDFSTKFVSAKAAAAKEAAEAQRGQQEPDEDVAANKKQRKRKGGQQELDEFADGKEEKKAFDGQKDLQEQLEDNFEGIGKKNTRKKKNKEANVFGDDALLGAFDEGADSDEMYAKKGKKGPKNKRQQGKTKKKQESEEEEEEPEVKPEEEEKEPEVEKNTYPLEVVYCAKCGLPVEYCSFGQKDSSACKLWLQQSHPKMFSEIYGEDATVEVGKEEAKEEQKEGEEGEQKPKKKVKFGKNADDIGVITVHKQKRGGRKVVCQILGFQHYTKDLKGLASKFGKKFSCGCNIAQDELLGECISVQGDVEDRLLEILEQDKDLQKLEVPPEKIKFVDDGNKKGRKRA